MTRRRFSAKALAARLAEFNGCCVDCGHPVGGAAGLEFDHRIPLAMGGEDEIANLEPRCRPCHRAKTKRDQGRIAKAKRMTQRSAGIKKQPKRRIPYRRFNGEIVWR